MSECGSRLMLLTSCGVLVLYCAVLVLFCGSCALCFCGFCGLRGQGLSGCCHLAQGHQVFFMPKMDMTPDETSYGIAISACDKRRVETMTADVMQCELYSM